MARKPPHIAGRWRITHVDDFQDEYVDAEQKAFIRFDADGTEIRGMR